MDRPRNDEAATMDRALDPLDPEEGKEVMVSIEDTQVAVEDAPSSDQGPESILQMFERLRSSVPPDTWNDLPTDLTTNKKHYLYGFPKESG